MTYHSNYHEHVIEEIGQKNYNWVVENFKKFRKMGRQQFERSKQDNKDLKRLKNAKNG